MAIVVPALAVAAILAFLLSPRFGALPRWPLSRARLSTKQDKPEPVRHRREGLSFPVMLARYLFLPKPRLKPATLLPVLRPDFASLPPERDCVIWLGHSSWFAQVDGKRILADPVFSSHASPLPLSTRAFAGTGICRARDIPAIDILLISHDHWDHLDYPTVKALRHRVGTVLCGKGVGGHFLRWGYSAERIREAEWEEQISFDSLVLHFLPTRHYSGRRSMCQWPLWGAWLVRGKNTSIYYSGDSGYGPHFQEAGSRFGPVDLAFVENGQYSEDWPHIHMSPEESVQAALDLRARAALPVHGGRFAIAAHPWDEPFIRFTRAAAARGLRVVTPLMGETLWLDHDLPDPVAWWRGDSGG